VLILRRVNVAYFEPLLGIWGSRPGSGARAHERRGRMLSWKGMLVKLLALAAVIASVAGEGEGWTW
jgi:hypothetical protein